MKCVTLMMLTAFLYLACGDTALASVVRTVSCEPSGVFEFRLMISERVYIHQSHTNYMKRLIHEIYFQTSTWRNILNFSWIMLHHTLL